MTARPQNGPKEQHLRLVTWNCFRGPTRQRAAALVSFQPDIIVLQECARATMENSERSRWFGANPKHGVSVLTSAPYAVRGLPDADEANSSVFACGVSGPVRFNLLAVWAQQAPEYVEAIWRGLDATAATLNKDEPTVVAGDFNSHPRFDNPRRRTHRMLEERLFDEFGVVSAWHALHADAVEPSTHYWQWREENGFHLDYCFVPNEWVPHLREVAVASYAGDWRSDHRPVLVDVALPTGTA